MGIVLHASIIIIIIIINIFQPSVNIIPREFKIVEENAKKCKNEYESQSEQSVVGKLLCNRTALKC